MGSLDDISGTIYLDANAFIYSVERIEPYYTILQSLWERARNGHCRIITSELTIMETLAASYQQPVLTQPIQIRRCVEKQNLPITNKQ